MKIPKKSNKLISRSVFGSTIYEDVDGKFTILHNPVDNKFYIEENSVIPEWSSEGFTTPESAQQAALDTYKVRCENTELQELLYMYGFSKGHHKFEYVLELPEDYILLEDEGSSTYVKTSKPNSECVFNNLCEVSKYIDYILNAADNEVFFSTVICNPSDTKTAVNAAMSSRDLSKNLVRVKSSNMWAYTINIKDRKDKVGDVLVQFKGKNGGPGDIYLYYDVPVNLWRRWLAAPSKGHFFWVNVRNVFQYRKLTGNKRGVLPNAVN